MEKVIKQYAHLADATLEFNLTREVNNLHKALMATHRQLIDMDVKQGKDFPEMYNMDNRLSDLLTEDVETNIKLLTDIMVNTYRIEYAKYVRKEIKHSDILTDTVFTKDTLYKLKLLITQLTTGECNPTLGGLIWQHGGLLSVLSTGVVRPSIIMNAEGN